MRENRGSTTFLEKEGHNISNFVKHIIILFVIPVYHLENKENKQKDCVLY